jgi:hypothetical protein
MKKLAPFLMAIMMIASASVANAAPHDNGPALLKIAPKSFHFGAQPVGSTSITTLTVTNMSDATVALCCFSLTFDERRGETGNMQVGPDPCGPALPEGISLAPGESCTVSILFEPIAPGKVVYDFCVGYVDSDGLETTDPRSCITLMGVGV